MSSRLLSPFYTLTATLYTLTTIFVTGVVGRPALTSIWLAVKLNIYNLIQRNPFLFLGLSYLCVFGAGFLPPEMAQNPWLFYSLQCFGLFIYFVAAAETDFLVFNHKDNLYPWERYFQKRMRNPKDTFFIEHMVRLSFVIIPPFIAIATPGFFNWFAFIMFFRGRFHGSGSIENLLHQAMHVNYLSRRHLKSRFDRMVFRLTELYLHWVLTPIMGMGPHYYMVHHIHNHHRENNGEADITTLAFYDRKSFFDFSKAAFRFFWSWATGYDLMAYLVARKKYKLARTLMVGMLYLYAIMALLFYLNPPGGWVFLSTLSLAGLGIAVQLWFWHSFVNNDAINNVYQNSINSLFNLYTNDGYHIEHHKRANAHYSKYPENVVKDIPRYIKEKSIIFRGLMSREQLLFLLFRKRFDILATHIVNFDKDPWCKKEIAAFLESRSQPANYQPRGSLATGIENMLVGFIHMTWGQPLKTPVVNYDKTHVEGWSEKLEKFFPGTEDLRPFPLTLQIQKEQEQEAKQSSVDISQPVLQST